MSGIQCQSSDGVVRVLLDRESKRNALTLDMVRAARAAIEDAGSNSSARILILGSTSRVFSAGMDLRDVSLGDRAVAARFADELASLYRAVLRSPIPVLSALDGAAVGGGLGLALAADLVWAGPGVSLALPETRLGLVPALVSVVLRRRLSAARVAAIAAAGRTYDAESALADGLVDFVPDIPALAAAEEYARLFVYQRSRDATRRTREFLAQLDQRSLDADLSAACAEFESAVASEDARRGLDAFARRETVKWDD